MSGLPGAETHVVAGWLAVSVTGAVAVAVAVPVRKREGRGFLPRDLMVQIIDERLGKERNR